jgi:hypothetical protein
LLGGLIKAAGRLAEKMSDNLLSNFIYSKAPIEKGLEIWAKKSFPGIGS